MVMVRPLVWFVLRVKPILLVTHQVKIHTHQPDLIQGSDLTMAIQELGNHPEEVSVGGKVLHLTICIIYYMCYVKGIQTMKSHLMNLRLHKEELHTKMETETTLVLCLLHIEGKVDPE